MRDIDHFMVGGPGSPATRYKDVMNPSTGDVQAPVPLGDAALLDRAVNSALAVQPGQEAPPGQPRRRDPGQHFPGAEPAVPPLDRPGRRIDGPDHAQPPAQLGDRRRPRIRSQRRIRRANPRQPALPAQTANPAHQIGALSAG